MKAELAELIPGWYKQWTPGSGTNDTWGPAGNHQFVE